MDTVLVIIVLFVALGLFGGVGFFFLKETGSSNAVDTARLWLTAPRQAGKSLVTIRPRTAAASPASAADDAAYTPDGEPADSALDPAAASVRQSAATGPLALGERPAALRLDDSALRELREELQGELRRASGITREFDARLTRIEANSVDTPRLSEELERSIEEHAAAHRRDLEIVRKDLTAVRQSAGSRGERRNEALAELYSHLARVESALAGVVNPMLLPGEPLTLPGELHPEALTWDNWSDVGERAYAFGEAFNQHRLVLDPETVNEIGGFIATLRQGLTGSVYPTVRGEQPTAAQLAQMRAGLEAIVAALPGVRTRIELAYRGETPADDA